MAGKLISRRDLLKVGSLGLLGLASPQAQALVGTRMRKRPQNSVIHVIESLSLMTGLNVCLDAGDGNSFNGSSQTWCDLSGSGNHFYRGATAAANTDDPTFNGAAGKLSPSEYFSFDGGDVCKIASATTFQNSWHQANGKFTIAAVMQFPSVAAWAAIFANNSGTSNVGIEFSTGNSGVLWLSVCHASATPTLNAVSTFKITAGDPIFVAVSVDSTAGAGGSFFQKDSSVETFNGTYLLPSAGTATLPLFIGAFGDGGSTLPAGTRLYSLSAWSRALSTTELNNYRKLVMARFS